jgi:hypothetical protein
VIDSNSEFVGSSGAVSVSGQNAEEIKVWIRRESTPQELMIVEDEVSVADSAVEQHEVSIKFDQAIFINQIS